MPLNSVRVLLSGRITATFLSSIPAIVTVPPAAGGTGGPLNVTLCCRVPFPATAVTLCPPPVSSSRPSYAAYRGSEYDTANVLLPVIAMLVTAAGAGSGLSNAL